MDDLYHDDFYAWSREQAAVLRGLADRRDLPNELDLEHVAEEIQDVGNAQLSAVQSYLRLILVHLLKAASVEASDLRTRWHGEIVGFHAELSGRFSKSMRQDIDLQRAWGRAYKEAKLSLESHGQEIAVPPGETCPLELGDFVGDEFDFDAALKTVEALRRPA
jgi:hypothetical protein